MGALTSTTIVPAPVQTYYDRLLLHRALPYLHYGRPADRRSVKKKEGTSIKFRRYEALGQSLAPLVEGSPPSGRQLTYTDLTQPLQQWGDFVPLTDFIQMTIQDMILNEANKLLGEQSGQVIDQLNRDEWSAGTNVLYGGTAAARTDLTTTTHLVSTTLLDKAIRTLENANAAYFNEMINATVKIATTAIAPSYWGVITPSVLYTLKGLSGWHDVWDYSDTGPILPGEVGAYRNIRFLQSTLGKVYLEGGGTLGAGVQGTTNADVHAILIFGQHAVAACPLEGASMQNIIKPKGSAGTADPLDQVSTSGWKHTGARKRLNETFMVRCEVTVAS